MGDNKVPPLIAHIVFALDTGGLENGLVNIINRLPENKFRHMVICLTTSGKFSERIEKPNVPVIELNKPPGHDVKTYHRLWKILREYRPDIVHSRNLAALESQLVTLALPGIKRIHGEHGRDMNDLDGNNRKYNIFRSLMRPMVNHYIAVSQDLNDWLIETVGVNTRKIRQIYNGVDLTKFNAQSDSKISEVVRPFIDDHCLVLGTVGRLTPVKDQKALLDAVALLLQENPSWSDRLRVVIVGDGTLRTSLEQQAKKLGLSELVWFAGDRDDVPQLLQCMDIFVLPSLAEGISNTLLEAMACSL
ncbi:glycosyltransferase, partial [Pseudomaricurvus sp.]|uniref:glycosyltransferase n=1 Tax=Pseudomaricurvus sp. TaxID=2004510 RepID=UPI003F6C3E3A